MEKVWKRMFFGLLIFVLVAAGASALFADIWLNQGSIRILGNYAKVSVHKTCYFIDPLTEEVTGSSTFRMDGFVFENFHGFMQLEQYPMSPELVGKWDSGGVVDGRRLLFSNQMPDVESNNEYFYIVQILKSDPSLIVITVSMKDSSSVTAVCADSAEEAVANYRTFLEKF